MLADKKKTMILAALGVVILGVGAFQFIGGSPEPTPAKSSKKTEAKKPAAGKTVVASLTGKPSTPGTSLTGGTPAAPPQPELTERDPFDGQRFAPKDPTKQVAKQPAPSQPAPPRDFRLGSGTTPLPIGGTLPSAGGIGVSPAPKLANADDFNYTASGVVTGSQPAVILADDKGHQTLVKLGGHIDGDSQVVSIARGTVTVRWHKGKILKMTVGANTPTEKRSDEK